MDLDRRKFIIGALKAAGVVGGWEAFQVLHRLGGVSLVKEAQAANIFINGHAGGSSTPTYATWKENTEIVSNSAVWLMEGGAAANETGVDSRTVPLTGADLVGTQHGGLAAATGSPPTREFDGTDDWMSWSQATYDIVSNGTSIWTLIIKGLDITEAQTAGHACPLYIYEGTDGHTLGAFQNTWQVWESSGHKIIDTTLTTPIAISGIVYACWFSDGTYVRCGWTAAGSGVNGQPTKWSDFPTNQRLTAIDTCIWANGSFTSNLYGLMRFNTSYTAGKISYLLMSDTCLIDNAA